MKTISACVFLAILAIVNARPEAEAQKPSYAPQPAALVVGPAKPYSFAYEVVDPAGGNAYGHKESSDGGVVRGEYRVVLPDTRTQIVTYSVSAETGYVAQVTYQGTPVSPAEAVKSARLQQAPRPQESRAGKSNAGTF